MNEEESGIDDHAGEREKKKKKRNEGKWRREL